MSKAISLLMIIWLSVFALGSWSQAATFTISEVREIFDEYGTDSAMEMIVEMQRPDLPRRLDNMTVITSIGYVALAKAVIVEHKAEVGDVDVDLKLELERILTKQQLAKACTGYYMPMIYNGITFVNVYYDDNDEFLFEIELNEEKCNNRRS